MNRLTSFLIVLLVGLSFFSQAQEIEMADGMRSSGKIYVVVCVIAIIFIGLAIYLFRLDYRLRKMEKRKKTS